jgi:hypothetical protein
VHDRAEYALLLLLVCVRRRRHALAGLLACRPLGARLQRACLGGQDRIPDTSLRRYRFISRDSLPLQIPHLRSNHMLQRFFSLLA